MDEALWKKMTEHTPLDQLLKVENLPEFEKVEENIWVIKNFVSQEILDKYKEFIDSLDEKEWWKKNKDWWVGKYVSLEDHPEIVELSHTVATKVESILSDDVYLGAFGSVHRLTPGQGMFIHTDNPTELRPLYDDNKNEVGVTSGHNNYCILAMVLYLNDFNDGNLYFPEIGIDYHGSAGELAIFPGTGRRYDHGVRPLGEGPNRYITTGFGYDQKVSSLKQAKYVFEDTKTGEYIDIEPSKVENDPDEVMKLPPRLIS